MLQPHICITADTLMLQDSMESQMKLQERIAIERATSVVDDVTDKHQREVCVVWHSHLPLINNNN